MRYFALATDYDGTLATGGKVSEETIAALEKAKSTGRKLIMVTGREVDDLKRVFHRLDLFDLVVAENGAVLYFPDTKEEKTLGVPPPEKFIEKLREKNVSPVSQGKVIVGSWEPHQNTILNTIREMGLEHNVIFNKGAVMVLPPGINKASGLSAALREMKLSLLNIAAIGDAENDNALLEHSGFSAAVANALDSLKEKADYVTEKDHGEGVVEFLEMIQTNDLADVEERQNRHLIKLGITDGQNTVCINPFRINMLTAGTSGSGKSTFTTTLVEKLTEKKYQFCLVDPEGDYSDFPDVAVFGDANNPPLLNEVIKVLEKPDENVIINTLAISFTDRPEFFRKLFGVVTDMRLRSGRPHCLILDEAHHLLPQSLDQSLLNIPEDLTGVFLITTKPELVSAEILKKVSIIAVTGHSASETLSEFRKSTQFSIPDSPVEKVEKGQILLWRVWEQEKIEPVKIEKPKTELKRHARKYTIGDVGPEKSFYFRGPEKRLNLRAQNLMLFIQMAEGVDADTWNYHLKRHDYSNWFRTAIKDKRLAREIEEIESNGFSTDESKLEIKKIIEKYYSGIG